MQPSTFIFIGRSGCGKGTQAELLQKHLEKHISPEKIFRMETGQTFREFIERPEYTAQIARGIYKEGGLMPNFLSIWIWTDCLVNNFKEGQYIIMDGSPRKLDEARIMDSAMRFYQRSKAYVIYINLSEEEATRRLVARKRSDDTTDDIKNRMSWFPTEVMPAVEYYRNNPSYTFIEIDGGKDREDISREILKATGHEE